jgi:ABC-type branched-subunit amino acid transport system substrate-binding protein
MNIKKPLLLAVTFSFSFLVQAEEVKIGFVAGITGPISTTVNDLRTVMKAYIAMTNAEGGINGNQLVLVEKDDGYDPKKTAPLVEEAIVKDKVVGIVNGAGTAPTIAIIKSRILNKYQVPLVGVFSGSDAIRGPGSAEIFHTRASYNDEVMRISRLAATLGLHRVAVLYQDDAFGQAILKSVNAAESTYKIDAFLKVGYKPGNKDFSGQVKIITAAKPQAIFLMGVPDATYQFMKAYDAPQGTSQIYALSFVTSTMLANIAGGEKVRGIAISQVVPNPHSGVTALVRDFQKLTNSPYGKEIAPSPVSLEAYLNIRLLVAAIKLAGPHPTSEKVMQSLASMRNYEIGGFPIDFAGARRNGSSYLDIAVVGPRARLLY